MRTTGAQASDPPQVAADIAAMRRSWDRRLAVNLFAVVAIVGYFVYPTWGRPDFQDTLMRILPFALGVSVLMVAVNRWFVARQARMIREAAGLRRA